MATEVMRRVGIVAVDDWPRRRLARRPPRLCAYLALGVPRNTGTVPGFSVAHGCPIRISCRRRKSGSPDWTAAGMALVDADDAVDLSTAFVVGFVIEEQERRQSSEEDPTRYSLAGRDAWLGEEFLMVREAGHARDDSDSRFERQLGIVLDGVEAREAWAHTGRSRAVVVPD